jgi:hypothetical protein
MKTFYMISRPRISGPLVPHDFSVVFPAENRFLLLHIAKFVAIKTILLQQCCCCPRLRDINYARLRSTREIDTAREMIAKSLSRAVKASPVLFLEHQPLPQKVVSFIFLPYC